MRNKSSGLRRYLPVFILVAADLVVMTVFPQLAARLLTNTASYFAEMLGVLPPVFLLLGLLDVWVPKETVMQFLGPEAGVRGPLLGILLGAAAAGPLYGAFPVAEVMYKKGASYFNIMIFIGAWSTLKIPMFLFETKALGTAFSVTRWLANLVVIFVIAAVMNRVLPLEDRYVRTLGGE